MTTVAAPPAAPPPDPGTTWTVVFSLHGTITKPLLSVTCACNMVVTLCVIHETPHRCASERGGGLHCYRCLHCSLLKAASVLQTLRPVLETPASNPGSAHCLTCSGPWW